MSQKEREVAVHRAEGSEPWPGCFLNFAREGDSLKETEDIGMGQETRMRGLSGGMWGLLGY